MRLHSELSVQAQTVMDAMATNMSFHVGETSCMTEPGNHSLEALKAKDYLSESFESDWDITTQYHLNPPWVTYQVLFHGKTEAELDELKQVAPRFGTHYRLDFGAKTLTVYSNTDYYLKSQYQFNRYDWSTDCFVDPL
ncbi:hypothetical protein [Vibrio sp. 10N.261.46.A3]|uniref:hypothetical protein n=1 Tax=Vibrio sp. 10N.261.46.A3 TaxID=3229658 RepID=UPI00355445FF